MFLQLRISRDGARFHGARDQATTGGRSSHQVRRAQRPAPGVWWEQARRADSVDLVPVLGAFSLFPPTWSPELPHTKERMQTLRETATANGEKNTGADLNWKRKHRFHELPHAFGLAFVVTPAAATSNEFS